MTESRNEFIAKAKEELDLQNAKVIELKAKANEKSGELRRELKQRLAGYESPRTRQNAGSRTFGLPRNPAREDVKQGVEHAWKSLARSVARASERFQ